jgi:hypothetical protein
MEFEDKRMVYDGEFKSGMMSGKGKIVYNNGMSYEGEWTEDHFYGEGTLLLQDGRVIKGTWLESNLIAGELYNDLA